jgi:hypothetical protein
MEASRCLVKELRRLVGIAMGGGQSRPEGRRLGFDHGPRPEGQGAVDPGHGEHLCSKGLS